MKDVEGVVLYRHFSFFNLQFSPSLLLPVPLSVPPSLLPSVAKPMTKNRTPLTLPELGMGQTPITVSLWLVEPGERVIEGDRVVEILAGAATVDLPAPTSGILAEVLVDEEEAVRVGQTLGYITLEQ